MPESKKWQEQHSKQRDVSYHCSDFDFDAWAQSCQQRLLPATEKNVMSNDEERPESRIWDDFYIPHKSGQVYKPRNYLFSEFEPFFNNAHRVSEVGCGFGCSIFPLLSILPTETQFLASDFSLTSLKILQENEKYKQDLERIEVRQFDIAQEQAPTLSSPLQDVVLCIFVLSAIMPNFHQHCLSNIAAMLKPGGYLLFRDYGIFDHTMFRHRHRVHPTEDSFLYRRDKDGTLAYYFSLENLRHIAEATGLFQVEELSYATVETRNRKNPSLSMKRVFVHMVCRKL